MKKFRREERKRNAPQRYLDKKPRQRRIKELFGFVKAFLLEKSGKKQMFHPWVGKRRGKPLDGDRGLKKAGSAEDILGVQQIDPNGRGREKGGTATLPRKGRGEKKKSVLIVEFPLKEKRTGVGQKIGKKK